MPIFNGTTGNDTLTGTSDHDQLHGLAGDDILNGEDGGDGLYDGAGSDQVNGGSGDDVIYASPGSGADVYDGGADVDWVNYFQALAGVSVDLATGEARSMGGADAAAIGIDQLLNIENVAGTDFDDIIIGNAANNYFAGAGGNDQLVGGDGSDRFESGTGNDLIDGGAGVDTALFSNATAGLTISLTLSGAQDTGEGVDTLIGIENIWAGQYDDTLTGNELDNELLGWDGADVLSGGAGHDTLSGGTGNDQLDGGSGNDLFSGEAGDDQLSGGDGNDTLYSQQGNDLLDGGTGADLMGGGADDDTYVVDNPGDSVLEFADAGRDTVHSSIAYILGANVENLILTGAAALNGWGNSANNELTGNDSDNSLYGLQGNDMLVGGGGNDLLDGGDGIDGMSGGMGDDTYIYDGTDLISEAAAAGTDTVLSSTAYVLGDNVENLTLVGTPADVTVGGTGNELDNVLTGDGGRQQFLGLEGNDRIDAGGGNDILYGGAGVDLQDGQEGSDIYTVDTAEEHGAAEFSDSGTSGFDDVRFASYSAGSTLKLFAGDTGIERVGAYDTAAVNIDASAVLNPLILFGNMYANILTGTAYGDTLSGFAGADRLIGNSGNDSLDGGSGADKLFGGTGDDSYTVDHASDIVVEYAGEGNDTVRSSVNHTLRDNVEHIELTGVYSIYANGNALANTMAGNSGSNKLNGLGGNDWLLGYAGNDTLDGGGGLDQMAGGVGNDQYYVAEAGDVTFEELDEGIDTVRATISLSLASNIENLVMLGSADLAAEGNELNNVMTGNGGDNQLYGQDGVDQLKGLAGNDWLDGGLGSDRLRGGEGDDAYVVDTTGDLIFEYAGEGIDSVNASGTYVLSANIENLQITGSNSANGTGNDLDNGITGNDGANILTGGAGHDTMDGGAGADVVKGGTGNDWLDGGSGRDRFYGEDGADVFNFGAGDLAGLTSSTCDQIHDFSQLQGDKIRLQDIDANSLADGDQGFSFLGNGSFTGTAGELRSYQQSGNTYVQGDTDGDGIGDFLIRLDGLHTLQIADFVI